MLNHTTTHRIAKLLHRSNRVSYELQRSRLVGLAEQYHPAVILAESNAMGEPIIESLRSDGLQVEAFQTTATSKPQIIEALMLDTEQGQIVFDGADKVMLAELQSFSIARTPSGRYSYGAPGGMHDDCVMALAIAKAASGRAGRWSTMEVY